jgi:hypothetical protein
MAKKSKGIQGGGQIEIKTKEDLERGVNTELALVDYLSKLFAKRLIKLKDYYTNAIRRLTPSNKDESQAESASELRLVETDLVRVALTNGFQLKDGEKIPAKFKTSEDTFITDNDQAIAILRKHAPELLATTPVYDEKAYWTSLSTEERKEKFEPTSPCMKIKLKGKFELSRDICVQTIRDTEAALAEKE